jgi:biopolymer transport protein ExbB
MIPKPAAFVICNNDDFLLPLATLAQILIYNVLARSTAHYRALLGNASAQVMKLVSRDLDRAKLPTPQAAE